MDKIEARWRILHRHREARIGDLLLVTTNDRINGGWGPVSWAIFRDSDGPDRNLIASGETWQGGRYSSLVRQAMFDAELAAKGLAK